MKTIEHVREAAERISGVVSTWQPHDLEHKPARELLEQWQSDLKAVTDHILCRSLGPIVSTDEADFSDDVKVLTPKSLHITVGRIDVNVDQCGHGTIKVDGVNLKARSVQIDVTAGEQPVVTVQVIP